MRHIRRSGGSTSVLRLLPALSLLSAADALAAIFSPLLLSPPVSCQCLPPSSSHHLHLAMPTRPFPSFTSYMLRALYVTAGLCALFPLFVICYLASDAFQSLLIHMHFVNFPFPFLTDFTKPTEPQWLSPALPCAAHIHTTPDHTHTPSAQPCPPLAGWLISPASRCPATSTLSTHLSTSTVTDRRCAAVAAFSRPVLYLHGNAENRAYRPTHDRYHFLTAFPLCADVFVFDYTGFGENSGWPTQEIVVEDAHRMLHTVNHWPDVQPPTVIVFGHSLGSAVAVQLLGAITRANSTRLSAQPPAGLIVEGAFTNVGCELHTLPPQPTPARLLIFVCHPTCAVLAVCCVVSGG